MIKKADKEEGTVLTILQSTDRYFSAGAQLGGKDMLSLDTSVLLSHEYWLDQFVAKNVFLTDVSHNPTKVLAAAVNGPIIGVSAALVALCDLVYAMDETKGHIVTPFTSLGLVAEGASSSTLFLRLGWSKATEAIILAKTITGTELSKLGFINKSYHETRFDSVDQFNQRVYDDLVSQFSGLYGPSILANKQLLKANRDQLINSASSGEVIKTFNSFVQGIPQLRFMEKMQQARKSKM